jgi:serine protease Do
MRCAIARLLTTMTLIVLVLQAPAVRGVETSGSASGASPSTIAELKSLEARAAGAIRTALPSIVAVNITPRGAKEAGDNTHFEPAASGVIIRRDGLILSQRHVSHVLRQAGKQETPLSPGDRIEVALQDGRRMKAELLGSDAVHDLSLLKIVEPGAYPCLEMARLGSVALGDRVIKLGHPFGYRADRGATARLGRVLYTGKSIEIAADCLTFGGDSGGPLIDLDGRLVGLIESAAAPQMVIFSFPPRCGNPTCYSSVATIGRLMPGLLNPPAGPKPEAEVDLKALPEFQAFMRERRKDLYGDVDAKVLPQSQWSQGDATRAAWKSVVAPYADSIVEVLGQHDRRVAYGTVVGAEGWILTKASEMTDEPRCRLGTGEIVPARVAGVDAAYDVALLKVDAPRGLRAVEWNGGAVRPAGKLLAAPDGRGACVGVGMVSVQERALAGPFPTAVTKAGQSVPKPLPQPLLGRMVEGKGLLVRRVKDAAIRAGIAPGDLLLSLNGQPLGDAEDVDRYVERSQAGDRVPAVIEREGRTINVSLKVEEDAYIRCPGAAAWYRSLRADDFPNVFEHDIPLTLDECGGPVIDLDGKAIGITIARVGQHGCMAIPGEVIPALVARLGKE